MVSVYVKGGAQLRVNRKALALLGIDAPCRVRLLFDKSRRFGAIQRDRSGEEWGLSIQRGVGFIGCKMFVSEVLKATKAARYKTWLEDGSLIFDYGNPKR